MNWKHRLLSLATATVVTTSSFAQQAAAPLGSTTAPDSVFSYTKKDKDLLEAPIFGQRAYFTRHFGQLAPRYELRLPAKFVDYAVDNKLELSLRSYLQLVLANNVDIDVQRLNVEIQRNAITRAYAPFDPFGRVARTITDGLQDARPGQPDPINRRRPSKKGQGISATA